MKAIGIEWSGLTVGQRIKHLELDGYVVIPNLLSPQIIYKLKDELSNLPTKAASYSDKQQYIHHVQWTNCPNTIEVVALPAMLEFLCKVFGDDLICTGCSYTRTEPGYPGMAIHTDSQPYGSAIFGMQSSAPRLVRVLYYLTDLTPERAPLKVIPYSHLSLHIDANPYKRYKAHPEEIMVICKAGSAVIINQKLFHGVFPNNSQECREVFAVSYRPAWAGPISDVPDHDPDKVAKLPTHIQKLFKSLNTRDIDFNVKNWTDDMSTEAPGLGPSRWNA